MYILKLLIILISLLTLCQESICAQESATSIGKKVTSHFDESLPQRIMPTRYGGRLRQWCNEAQSVDQQLQYDSLAASDVNDDLSNLVARCPMIGWGGFGSWSLHRGLNVQLGASVFAEFGKGARSGAGFQQNVALMYALPINDKLSVAIGGYLNNINYAGGNWRDAGVTAVVGYRFNEHWEAYVYGQKSISNNLCNRLRYNIYDGYYGYGSYSPMGGFGGFSRNYFGMPLYSAYDLAGIGDRIGATVRYNFNNNMSIEVSVENRWLP